MFKFVMRPKAKRKLVKITEERANVEKAIKRARKNKQRVSDLYARAQELTVEAHRWERYLK